jgi:hypothetical protein
MTNVEIRMTKEVRNPNDETVGSSFGLRHSSFFRHSGFVICDSSLRVFATMTKIPSESGTSAGHTPE